MHSTVSPNAELGLGLKIDFFIINSLLIRYSMQVNNNLAMILSKNLDKIVFELPSGPYNWPRRDCFHVLTMMDKISYSA